MKSNPNGNGNLDRGILFLSFLFLVNVSRISGHLDFHLNSSGIVDHFNIKNPEAETISLAELNHYTRFLEQPHSRSQSESELGLGPRAGVIKDKLKWKNATVVFSIFEKANQLERTLIYGAMREISQKTCIKFRIKTSAGKENFVKILKPKNKPEVCSSSVGMTGNSQKLLLGEQRCFTHGRILHQLLHTIGLVHEHQRPDRDNFVIINWDNIIQSERSKFLKVKDTEYSSYNVTYDFHSILHGGNYKNAINPNLPTIIQKSCPRCQLGQGNDTNSWRLTKRDAWRVNRMYSCLGNTS